MAPEPRIAVVGTCASGKSSVVAELRARGFDAFSVAQEHSGIAELWRHLEPDHLVVLEVSLEEVRRRRDNDAWPEWIYDVQRSRIASAVAHADLVVQTDGASVAEIADQVERVVRDS